MNNQILELNDVGISFDNKKTYILKDINFGLSKGEVMSIIGVNGSGKTTLLKVIAGIYKNSLGKIKRNYKRLSYVPQKIDIDKTFPIRVNEFIQIYNDKINQKELLGYFKKFDSEKLIDKNISALSGGELQKVLIISALISKPDIILLDEPTSGIDIIGEDIFYELVGDIKKIFPHISIILISHNINLVYKNSDKVVCLHKDNFCCHGTPKEINDNIEVKKIFGDYVLPYEHTHHNKHIH